ncbi:hypothetical protein BDN72DRAFT_864116 [Pluteus cervinus]|uniref:Uncharacterized protein n=1 Tax=Pluteus cervinus TaxID=181527 RepID=A0ACD3A518_9AGAR|nr:hypothetical protein BDN72DRAFT_864116 [Pluteus cervinus]
MDSFDGTPNPTIEQERAELDAKIHELEIALIALKRRRNYLSSISKIPSDVLRQIFKSVTGYDGKVQLLGLDGRGVEKENRLEMAWIRTITHVCSAWRDLALDSPSLWTRIRINSRHEIVLEMLERSRSLPLTISLMYLGGDLRTLESVLLEQSHIQRIKHLELGLAYHCYQWVLEKLDSSPPINLESCSLSTTAGGTGNIFSSTMLPVRLLQYSSDTLCHLQVSRCTFDFRGVDGILSLPHLRTLVLNGLVWEDIAFLDRLSFPHTCMVTLDGCGTLPQEKSDDLKRAIQRIWGPGAVETEHYFRGFTINISRTPYFSFAIDDTEDFVGDLVIRHPYTDPHSFRAWFNAFPLGYIQTLRIEASLPLAHWKLLVHYCPNIISLSFNLKVDKLKTATWFKSVFYIHDLSKPTRSLQDSDEGDPDVLLDQRAFLKLERLEVIDTQLDRSAQNVLLDCVKQRLELGIPIQHLMLQRITAGFLEALTPYVDGEVVYHSLDDGSAADNGI